VTDEEDRGPQGRSGAADQRGAVTVPGAALPADAGRDGRRRVYHVICVVLGCIDLHGAAREMLANRVDRLRRRPARFDESRWHPRDRRAARWYSWLLPVGYVFSIGVLVVAAVPVAYRFLSGVFGRFGAAGAGAGGLAQLAAVAALATRDRRRRRAAVPGPS
jgi:hypothetical protein